MAISKTRTIKNKHASTKSSSNGAKRSATGDSDTRPKSKPKPKGVPSKAVTKQVRERKVQDMLKKRKKKSYTAEQLDLPTLNTITPIGVTKPKGKKKGKVFVDDKDSMTTIMSIVQAEKNGQIESKMIKARQMEEIREARKVEMDKKEFEKNAKMEDAKFALRKRRKRKGDADNADGVFTKEDAATNAVGKSRKRVSFA